jgi:hypothetical protein
VLYKCITKILANRFRNCLGDLISSNQTAFVKGRVISENILLAQELVKGYHKNKGKARCAIKVDLKKAYDSVEWNFILMSLLAVGCPANFVNWIRECITTPRFSIALNGSLVGYFKGGKGLRQGDPLSPYLFVMAMEVFTKLLSARVRAYPQFQFHPHCKNQHITHLCFADDLMLFVAADIPSIKLIKVALEDFRLLSGLSVNQSKSEVFCAAVSAGLQTQILSTLQFRSGRLPVRYLGMPLIAGKLSYADCKPLIDKITSRISSWSVKLLSFSGRLQLIQSVLNSIQMFWSSIFILPKKVVKAIEQRFNQFLWKGQEGGRGGIKVSWDQVCLPKQEGGLGLKKVEDWNKAAVMKHIWNLFTQAGSLWVAWIHSELLKGRSFWTVKIPQDCSWGWRKLLKLRHLRVKQIEVNWWKLVWFTNAIPKHSFIGWLTIRNRLVTKDRLLQWGLGVDPMCLFCRQNLEDRDHLFFKCPFTNRIWKNIMGLCLVSDASDDWHLLVDWGI